MAATTHTPRNINRQLDLAVLGGMVEPLNVSISRILGGQRTPIILPAKDENHGPGEGWETIEIKRLEGWLATDFAGGGLYNIKVTDSNNVSFEWQPFFDPKLYPPKQPYTMQSAEQQIAAATQQPQNTPQVQLPQPQMVVSAWPPASPMSYATPIPQVQQPMTVPYQFPFQGWPQPQRLTADDDRRRLEDEKRILNERLAQAEREKLAAEHRADLERIRQESDRKLDELKASLAPKTDESLTRRLDKMDQMFERMMEKVTTTPAPTGPSPELIAMQRQLEDQNRRMEDERAERRHSEQLAAIQKANADQVAAVQRQLDAMAARPTGPDPMMVMFIDTMKDNQRQTAHVMDSMKSQMMTPAEVLAFTKASGDGVNDLKTNVVKMFTDVFELQKKAFETASNLLPQGESPLIRVAENLIEGGKDVFEKIAANKDAAQIAQAKAATAQAKAQEAMVNAQRSQMEEMSRRENEARAAATVKPAPLAATSPTAPISSSGNGLSGASSSTPQPAASPASPTDNGGRVLQFVKPTSDPNVQRLGKTDAQWFGGALPHVERLRSAVTEWLIAASSVPPTATLDGPGASPVQAAGFVLQSANTILEGGIKVVAFDELFLDERLADFTMVLLPDAPHQYRQMLIDSLKEMQAPPEEDEDDEDVDEDEDEDDGQHPAKVEAPPAPVKATRPPRRPSA